MVQISSASRGRDSWEEKVKRWKKQGQRVWLGLGRENQLLVMGVGTIIALMILILPLWMAALPDANKAARNKHKHSMKLPGLNPAENSLAYDIFTTLDCDSLMNKASTGTGTDATPTHRRLDDVYIPPNQKDPDYKGLNEGLDFPMMDDLNLGAGDNFEWSYDPVTARKLFCMAAGSEPVTTMPHCDVLGSARKPILDLWSDARSQMQLANILKTLDLATEIEHTVEGSLVFLWAPSNDEGITYVIDQLNLPETAVHKLNELDGQDKLFVDVGSNLGLTSMAIKLLYKGTKVIAIEPAGPSWILQSLNFVCNLPPEDQPISIMSGVGGAHKQAGDVTMQKVMWRPQATSSTRPWTSKSEHLDSDIELVIRLKPLHSILREALDEDMPVTVLNLDCQGCEYNLIPSLSEKEFDDIPTIIGNVHWGYIPADKLPSSKRAKSTHERLCQHKLIAMGTRECCAFPNLKVHNGFKKSAIPKTVSDVIQDGLCDSFSSWAETKSLYTVDDDGGWVELTSMSEIEDSEMVVN
eukprot:CAMPEP_0198293854 /NCGR_PEP_ID=MMETSP1449-20131203/19220_1 /TAXON_ID=420275 /ORGANISM="Attheya septentrionalis, Strain CCMP2084" /LENGTH=524 /DNA_ID=CAMNT_0043993597 /DNA_START=53 /DNA_END=1627 /DNA_ORIENTATION=+